MRDPRLWRELYIRGGMTLIITAIAYFLLHVTVWVWLIPVGVGLLVVAKWLARPPSEDE